MSEAAQNVIPMKYIPGHLFEWIGGNGITEISTIEANRYGEHLCGLGFWVKSNKTGNFCYFEFIEDECNSEGETIAWVAESLDKQFVIKILND